MNVQDTNQMQPEPAKPQKRSTKKIQIAAATITLLGVLCFVVWSVCFKMPGESYQANRNRAKFNKTAGSIQDDDQQKTKQGEDDSAGAKAEAEDVEELKAHIEHLAKKIGERNLSRYESLCEAADYVENQLKEYGFEPSRQTFQVRELDCFNIEVEIKGTKSPEEIVIIGGHYDSAPRTPGANDNGSGTAAMLVLAKHFREYRPEKTLRFVAWTNEEPPYFQNQGEMGSWVYAEKCRKEDQNIVGVISLETMGYFSDEEDSQKYPAPLNLMYPSTGNFIGFVSNLESRKLQRKIIKTFRTHAKVPSEGASLPDATPGVGWSDHWSFWQEGYLGIMVTDTAPFRYPHYHKPSDTPDKIDYETLAKVITGLVFVVEDLVTDVEE